MSGFRHDWLDTSDHSILINRPDTSWSLSLCPLVYDSQPWMRNQLPDFSFCCAATDSERLWLRSSIRDQPEESLVMDEASSHLQSFLTTPVSSLSHARGTLLLTYCNSHGANCVWTASDRESWRDENKCRVIKAESPVQPGDYWWWCWNLTTMAQKKGRKASTQVLFLIQTHFGLGNKHFGME